MKSTFPGFPAQMPCFFRELRQHNDRDWFDAHRDVYEKCVKTPMLELTAIVAGELTRFAPEYATVPRKAIFRINRDTRFSNDKSPYKTHTGALLQRADLPKNAGAAFYFAVSDKCVEVAGGSYMAQPEQLKLVRAHIAANAAEFTKLVTAKRVVAECGPLQGEALARPPRGYAADAPGVEYVRMKQWYHYVELDTKLALTGDVVDAIVSRFRRTAPLVEFLNAPLVSRAERDAPLTGGWF